MDLVIERSGWLRGGAELISTLLSPATGRMCCLGFYALAYGYKREDIRGRTTPNSLDNPLMFPSTIITERGDSAQCGKLMKVNDDPELLAPQREQQLTTLFKEINVNVTFID